MPNEFLEDLGKTVVPSETGDGIPPATPPVDNNEPGKSTPDDTKKAEEQVPFHQHPRWKARETEWQEKLDAMKASYDEELGNIKKSVEGIRQPTTETIPEWYKYYYGEDVKGYELYKQTQSSEKDRIKQEVIAEIRKEEATQQATTQKWNDWIETELKSLEESGKQFDRNKLLKQMEDYPIYRKDGLYDFSKSYELYEKFEGSKDTTKSDARKDVASDTTPDKKGEPQLRDYVTAKEVRGRGFPRFTDN